MASGVEIKFTGAGSGKELHFVERDNNSVSWHMNPNGEEGISRIFSNSQEMENFMRRYAALLGFKNRVI